MRRNILALAAAGLLAVAAPASAAPGDGAVRAVLTNYADIAQAMYSDSLAKAKELQAAVQALTDAPSAATMQAAKRAWLAARVPYQQTEVYRFGNAIVDEWEGKVNAWPLDEGLIDYVDSSYGTDSDENPLYTANVIANPKITHGGEEIDASTITKELLAEKLQEIGGVEANVATGYHAIEFLLWGQDLNGTGPGAGSRPWTDYAKGASCTNGNCDRRAQYLIVATDLVPLVGLARPGRDIEMLDMPDAAWSTLRNYCGSAAVDAGGTILGVTSPRGGRALFWEAATRRPLQPLDLADGCGLAAAPVPGRFIVSNGLGALVEYDPLNGRARALDSGFADARWDNHIFTG